MLLSTLPLLLLYHTSLRSISSCWRHYLLFPLLLLKHLAPSITVVPLALSLPYHTFVWCCIPKMMEASPRAYVTDVGHRVEYKIRDLGTRSVTLFPLQAQVTRDIKDVPLKVGVLMPWVCPYTHLLSAWHQRNIYRWLDSNHWQELDHCRR